jgi:drug/metabolite transporter (DMT)-like permease
MALADERRKVAETFRWMRGERTRVQLALLTVQLGYGGYYVLTKVAMSDGVNRFVFAVYRDCIALALLGPLAFFSERKLRPAMTWTVAMLIFALGFTGIFLQQTLFLTGLAYTNTAFAAAMQNAIPVFTFVIAVICKLEVIRFGKPDGVAKVVGIIAAVAGALTMCLYKGPTLFGSDSPIISNQDQQKTADDAAIYQPGWLMGHLLNYGIDYWQIGSLCLVLNCLCMGIYTNLQIPALKRFPAPASLSASSIGVGLLALVFTGLGTISDRSDWVLSKPGSIISVVYAGAIASGLNFTLQCWANQKGGPVLVAAYIPLQTVFSAFLGVVILDDPLYLGSVIGAVLILVGLYLVIWGQRLHRMAKDRLSLHVPFSGVNDLEEPLLKSPLPISQTTTTYGAIQKS